MVNTLLKLGSIAILYAVANFFASNGFANPDKIAASLVEVADEATSPTASTIVRARVEEDLAGLVSTVILTGTAKDGTQSGKSLSEMLSMSIVDPSAFTSPQPTSLRVISCSLSPQGDQLDWRSLNHLNVSFCFNSMPSPDYTATYALEIPSVKASGQVTFRTDDMTPQLRDLLPRAIGISDMNLTLQTSFRITPPRHVRPLLDALKQTEATGDIDLEDASVDELARIARHEITLLAQSLERTQRALDTTGPGDRQNLELQRFKQQFQQMMGSSQVEAKGAEEGAAASG